MTNKDGGVRRRVGRGGGDGERAESGGERKERPV